MTTVITTLRKINLGCHKLLLYQVTGSEDNEKIYVCVCVCIRMKSYISIETQKKNQHIHQLDSHFCKKVNNKQINFNKT